MSHVILAIDTALNSCSVALYKKKYIYSLLETSKKQHTVKILPMIKKILLHTETKLSELNAIAFSKGPGNFTSIRVSTGIVQTVSLSFNIPIISVSTLVILAEQAWRKYKKKKILVAINAGVKRVYWAQYTRHQKSIWIGEETESLITIESLLQKWNNIRDKWTLVGNGWKKILNEQFIKQQNINIDIPNAKDIIPFVLLSIKQKKFLKSSEIDINYLNSLF